MKKVLPAIECLACPLDGQPLELTEKGNLICPQNHSYDRARQGYFNLLPVQFKPSKDPGDSKEMVAARKRVLDLGVFDPVCDALIDVVGECIEKSSPDDMALQPLLVDAGCGDGYYTSRIASKIPPLFHVLGMDISKWALITAARRNEQIAWAVANNKRLPVLPGAAHIITSLFGFETWQPWSDIQSAGQWVITVDAAKDHLLELRELIYDVVEQHNAPDDTRALNAGYEKIEELPVFHQVKQPAAETLADIVVMTPHGNRATHRMSSLQDYPLIPQLTIDVLIRVYRRR